MRTTAAGGLQRGLQRSQPGSPAGSSRRGELAAALATIALITELLVPAALVISVVLVGISRVSRWPARWLGIPLLAGAGWLAASGPGRALAAVATGSGWIAAAVAHVARDPSRVLRHPGNAVAGVGQWLPRELPLALAAGAGQAGFLVMLRGAGSHTALLAAVRRWRSHAILAAGETVTETGCAIGLDARTGRLVGFGWADAERGVLVAGRDTADVTLAVAGAAMRRRKTVLVLDVADRHGAVAGGPPVACGGAVAGGSAMAGGAAAGCTALAGRLGVRATWVRERDGDIAAAAGRAVRTRGVVLAAGPAAALVADVHTVLDWLRRRGLRGDCLLWVSGCEAADAGRLADLLALGPATGTAVLFSTASQACAEALAPHVRLTVGCGPVGADLAARLVPDNAAAADLSRQPPGAFTMIWPDGVRPGCRSVPIAAPARAAGRATALAPAGRAPASAPTDPPAAPTPAGPAIAPCRR